MAKYKSQTIQRTIPQKLKLTQALGFRLIEGTVWPLSGEDKFGWGIRDKDYEALYSKYGNNDFLFEPWSTVDPALRLEGITKQAYEAYIHKPQFEFEGNVSIKIKSLVQRNQLNQIVTDFVGDDGYLYNIEGNPIYRSFYISLGSKDYKIKEVSTKLIKKYKAQYIALKSLEVEKNAIKIGSLSINPVPYYSQESYGSKNLVFNFYPKNYKQFMEIYRADQEDCLIGAEEKILNILRIKQRS